MALCYLPAMRAGFVWDDDLLVTENPLVKGADSLPYVWGSAASTDYTPLTMTAFWPEWRLWGDNAAGYHIVNILLYGAVGAAALAGAGELESPVRGWGRCSLRCIRSMRLRWRGWRS